MTIQDILTIRELERCRITDIPPDWSVQRLGAVAETEYGISEAASDSPNAEMIGMKHLANGVIDFNGLIPVSVSDEDVQRYHVGNRELLFNRTNSPELVGKTSISLGVPHERVLFASYLIRIHTDETRLLPEFANYFMNSHLGVTRIKTLATPGVGQYNVNPASLRNQLLIPVPPLPEQQKIAAILSTWDRAIELTEKLIAAKQKRKQALMQQLLTGKVRFEEFEGEPWREVKLGKVFTERRETGHDDLPLLSITSGEGIVHRDTLDRKDSSNADKSKYLRICPGDIGYNTMRMWQGVSALSDHEGIVSPAYTICTPNSAVDARFMSYLFKYPPVVHKFWRYSQGMVRDTLNLKYASFSKIKLKVPIQKEEQQKVGQVLLTINDELSVLEHKSEQIEQQKKGLIQQLLTGKVRAKVGKNNAKP
jgi:type I restriction enzyme S subunit